MIHTQKEVNKEGKEEAFTRELLLTFRILQETLLVELRRERRRKASMLKGKAKIQDTDMPLEMQLQAMSTACDALDLFDALDCRSIAGHIKKEFDLIYGAGWQCVVGRSFGCFFTHSEGTFIYFRLESLKFLIFRGASL